MVRRESGALRRATHLILLAVSCLKLAVGKIDESCDEEAQREECEALSVVYDAWNIHVEDYCDGETDPEDVSVPCDDAVHIQRPRAT